MKLTGPVVILLAASLAGTVQAADGSTGTPPSPAVAERASPARAAGPRAASDRDPFRPLAGSADAPPSHEAFSLVAVVATRDGALAVLRDALDGDSTIVKMGDALGDAVVQRIDVEREVVVLRVPARTLSGYATVELALRG